LFFLLSSVLVFAQKTQARCYEIDRCRVRSIHQQVANKIWEYAEVGYQETKSSALLQETLSQAGFKIEKGVAGMPTAFIASYGTGKPVIGILGEYDALPGVSQDAVPELKKVEGRPAGHACGHHLFGTASAAAAIAVKDWLIANKKGGTIRFYGTPAEEGGSGKVYMVREGLFKDVDVVFHWHPGAQNNASAGSSLANKTGKFRFYGIASHAAAAPDRGRSALDGVEAMNDMVNMMREHVTQESRIHYVITRGGEAPNVVPAFAEVYYYARHPSRAVVKDMWERLTRAAQGAALGTDTKVEWEITGGVYDLLTKRSTGANSWMPTCVRWVAIPIQRRREFISPEKIQKTFTTEQFRTLTTTNTIGDFKVESFRCQVLDPPMWVMLVGLYPPLVYQRPRGCPVPQRIAGKRLLPVGLPLATKE
jgi:aminobenzoyl-glutamate utilization protein B